MNILSGIIYVLVFFSVYVQVFFLVTFLEKKKKIILRRGPIDLEEYPGVTIIIPCYNTGKTVIGTVKSLLSLDYPKDKLKLIIVDDGSTDDTWQMIQKFTENPNIRIFHKKNGGKYTALNMGLEVTETPFMGCLDPDSFVDSQALKRIMTYFLEEEVMAVAPSIIVDRPKNILQGAQKAEYDMSIYNKKMLAFLGGIHVAPGPFSIFRKKVFDDLGPYRHAHNTEDQEIALRMQENHYRIEHCPDAYVYTIVPNTVKKLYRQRLRWIYGFIRNAIDYRRLLFKKKYGTLAFFTIPSGLISVISVVFLLIMFSSHVFNFISKKILQISTVGANNVFSNSGFNIDMFFFDTKAIVFISIILYSSIILSLLLGRAMIEGRFRFSWDVLYFTIIYSLIAPLWISKALLNTVLVKKASNSDWTKEIDKRDKIIKQHATTI